MPSLSASAPSHDRAEVAPPAPAPTVGPRSNSAALSRTLGGGRYTIAPGDTLSGISRSTYGHARYWRQIMAANPDRVFRGGDLIIAGHELVLPLIAVPVSGDQEEAPAPTPAPAPAPSPDPAPPEDGGVTPAHEPRGVCTEWGDFLVYPDAFVGPLPGPGPDGVEHVRESELDGVLAQRRAAAEEQRRSAVSSIEELLSYDWDDWAVTDAEATRALNLLGSLHFTQIKPALDSLGSKFVGRLLDNLPDEARRTQAFAKVIVALGPAAARPHVEELLSYGLFDWAITDGDIDAICEVLALLPPDQQAELVLGMSQRFQSRFARNLSQGSAVSDDVLKQLFDNLPDEELEALKLLLGARFNIEVGGRGLGNDWTAPALRQAWVLLEQLPPGHVADNDMLDLFLQGGSADGSGYYRGSDDSAVIEFSDLAATGGYGQVLVDDGAGNMVDVGLHSNVNLFNTVVRHEIGHAVDAKLGISAAGGYATTAANAGAWAEFADAAAWKQGIIDAGGGFTGHGYPDEAKYEEAFHKAVDDAVDFNEALADIDEDLAPATPAVGGPVAAIFALDRWHPSKKPWYDNPDRPGVGGRVFHKAYEWGRWVSFQRDARVQFGISAYQWRAPGEWFAEAYACFYSDHDSATAQPVGTRLRTRDPQTADWMAREIDQGHSLAQETRQAGTGAPAGGGST